MDTNCLHMLSFLSIPLLIPLFILLGKCIIEEIKYGWEVRPIEYDPPKNK